MKRARYFGSAVALALIVLFSAGNARAGNIFLPEIQRAVHEAIPAWINGDAKGLKRALERLTRNEAYLLAIGQSTRQRSYLVRVPRSLNGNVNSVAACLFMIRTEKQGISLWPKSLFEGKRFEMTSTGGE